MKLLIDNQFPVRLAIHLRNRGHECVHVLDIGLALSGDLEVWEYAKGHGFIVVSKDEDFFFLANRVGEMGSLIWVRIGNCRNDALIKAFDRVLQEISDTFASGQRIVEIR